MVSTGVNYTKLKTNLKLAINRMKMLEKKKTELAQKARKEIGHYILDGKYERARIKVEHIIREDYIVEAMELVEMYCDLLLARFGLIQQMKTLDDGLAEAISSLIWVAPRLQTDIQELKVISDLLTYKYGKQYAQACRENALKSVNEKLMIKMGVQAPPKILVEKYLIEIAKSQNIPYEPDPDIMRDDECYCAEETAPTDKCLIDLGFDGLGSGHNFGGASGGSFGGASGGASGGGGGYGAVAYPPPLPAMPPSAPYAGPHTVKPAGFNVEPPSNSMPFPNASNSLNINPDASYNKSPPPNYETAVNSNIGAKSVNIPPDNNAVPTNSPSKPTPTPRTAKNDSFPELPSVPTGNLNDNDSADSANNSKDDSIDFEDLTKRFEELKKRK